MEPASRKFSPTEGSIGSPILDQMVLEDLDFSQRIGTDFLSESVPEPEIQFLAVSGSDYAFRYLSIHST